MVQVPKEDPTQISICADLTKLNFGVKHDTNPSSSVDPTFSSKYQGRNSVYYEIPQEDNPQILLATFITPFGYVPLLVS